MSSPHQRAEQLLTTLQRVEERTDLRPYDPVLLELKRVILLRIAELEPQDGEPAPEIPPESPKDAK